MLCFHVGMSQATLGYILRTLVARAKVYLITFICCFTDSLLIVHADPIGNIQMIYGASQLKSMLLDSLR